MEAELLLLQGDDVVHVHPIGPLGVRVGRAHDNDLVLADSRVSSHHLLVQWSGEALEVHDLGSTNGTEVGGSRLSGPRQVDDGALIVLGGRVRLRVRLLDALTVTPIVPPLLEDRSTGIRHPMRRDRFRIGSGPESDLVLPEGPALAATVTLHDNGEIWVGTDDEEFAVVLGEPFEVGRRSLVFVAPDAVGSSTEQVVRTQYPYKVVVTLDSGTGPEAVVEDLAGDRRHVVTAENRATLLYILARRLQDHLADGLDEAERGWCDDDEVVVGIWGRRREQIGPNNYQVLLCRVRKELKDAGFDGWFIEKRRGYTRLRLDAVEVT